jgi:hypothetical protein
MDTLKHFIFYKKVPLHFKHFLHLFPIRYHFTFFFFFPNFIQVSVESVS